MWIYNKNTKELFNTDRMTNIFVESVYGDLSYKPEYKVSAEGPDRYYDICVCKNKEEAEKILEWIAGRFKLYVTYCIIDNQEDQK